ncbi:chemotaxis protein CheR [Mycobacterium gordonae]|uniref:protein-glutamate O-methyltransferase n=1 Tax=Mycobacterium gordonae TaxID=1778 RepID=A0A1A6BM58_MYCGO|nr:CheR family methyltransferase [Mycobacterium gordonae]MBI2700527.1 PAS domain S-box protein [Mycobacterium sp.]OBS03428.1 chemotaxis protein CheR [Mycobacterium gordonae]
MNDPTDESFEALLRYLRDSRGFDFTGYKRASLMRRVRYRMEQAGCVSFEDYLDMLQASSDEFAALFNTILINVTAFFRDPPAWDFVASDVIPRLLANRGPDDPVRVWSAGCASGQEAYSLTMLLVEAMGADAFRQRVKIYATDIDEDALRQARLASYDARAVESVPPEFLDRYFERVDDRYVFHTDLRRSVIFGRNDLVKDAPISRVDLLVCRNTLIYLNAETQRNVLNRLHFALAPHGILFLGRAEMLLSQTHKFTPLNLENRLFVKAAGSRNTLDRQDPTVAFYERQGDVSDLTRLREIAYRASPVAQIVVTGEDTVAMINQQAETLLGVSARDIGRLLRDLEVSYRPVELRLYLEQAKVERRPARIPDIKWQRPAMDTVWLEIHVNPLVDADNGLLGVSIAFFDVTATRTLLDKVVHTNRQLEAAYEELQSTNEELETTNEELQSTVEELETTNEELQSTNEELETMNEELQSTNDVLQTTNDALRERSGQLDEAKNFLDALINAVRRGLILVDRELRVVVWNRACEDLWGLRSDETIGKKLSALDIGLPVETVQPLIGQAFVNPDSAGEIVVDAVNRRGRQTRVRVTCTPFPDTDGGVGGSLLLMEVVS